MTSILLYSGLIVYMINYIIGWLLFYKKIMMTKRTHQIFYAAILLILAAELLFVSMKLPSLILAIFSLVCMIILPFGVKGSIYHRLVSSVGTILYFAFFILSTNR